MTPVLIFEELRFPLELFAAMLIFLVPFAEKKPRFLQRISLCMALCCLLAISYFPIFQSKDAPRFPNLLAFWYVLIPFAVLCCAKVCFDTGWCNVLFLLILAFATQIIVYVVLHETIARALFPSLREHLVLYILSAALCCLLVYLPVWKVFRRPLHLADHTLFEDDAGSIVFYLLLFALTIVSIFYCQNTFSKNLKSGDLSITLVELSFSIFILIIEYSLLRSRSLLLQNALLEQTLRSSDRYYEMSRQTVEIINRKCHDLKHQLKALQMASDDEREAYIQKAQKDILFYQNLVHSDNQVINTILAEKGLFCEEKNISLSCSVNHVNIDFIHVTDLYAMLGNAIDNAIEYVSQFDDEKMRVISISIAGARDFVSIQVINPYEGPDLTTAEGAGFLLKTTKKDTANHGFGLSSIRYVAEKYHGHMEISTADHLFTLQVLIPIGS